MNCMITEETVKNRIGRRNKEIHKGDCGRVLIAAGSWGMAGAAILAARAALRAGAGLVRLAIPEALFPIVQVGVPEATCIERNLSKLDFAVYDAVCVGPGLGEGEESIALLTKLLETYEKTLIIDADGLNIIAHQDLFELLLQRQEHFPMRTVLTPHMGEAKRLLGDTFRKAAKGSASDSRDTAANLHDEAVRIRIADALTAKTGAIIVLKGAGTLVAAPGMQTYTNTTGNPGMATGGSGDVLSGIITGLAGQRNAAFMRCDVDEAIHANEAIEAMEAMEGAGIHAEYRMSTEPVHSGGPSCADKRVSAWDAAVCGVYLHGLAGDLAAQDLGEYGLTAGDLAQYTAYALKQICAE